MNRLGLTFFLLAGFAVQLNAQFAPAAGSAGTDAIHADSSCFINWATACSINKGLMQIDNPTLGFPTYGQETDALGKADNIVVSLGDGGKAVLQFGFPLWNGPGPDFAVFENAFTDEFLELALVAVSSDGINYFEFPAISLSPVDEQIAGFGTLDATKLHLLAGKYRVFFGVPFDLDSIPDTPLLDKMSVTHVLIKDVVGKLDVDLGSFDSRNALINDPWPTPFPSSGFDLDGVGVIHDASNLHIEVENEKASFQLFPNPFTNRLSIHASISKQFSFKVYDSFGQLVFESMNTTADDVVNTSDWKSGVYLIQLNTESKTQTFRMIKL